MPRPLDWHVDSKTAVGGHVKREGRRNTEMEMTYVNAYNLVSDCKYHNVNSKKQKEMQPEIGSKYNCRNGKEAF